MRRLFAVAFGILLLAAPAGAQTDKPVDVNFGFGWTFPTSGLKDSFDTGWNGGLGVTFNLTPNVGIQGEYMYHRMNGPEKVIQVSQTPILAGLTNGILESNQQIHSGTFNLVYRQQMPDSPIGWYGLAGPGVYHRTVQVTSPSIGYTTYCDPYWYVCYPTAVSIDRIIGDRSSTDFGINFGAGVTFGHEAKFYVETRYHYVWGPEVSKINPLSTEGASTSSNTNASYFPLTFGVRW